MEIIHSDRTRPSDLAAEAAKISPLQEGGLLAGAVLHEAGEDAVVGEYWAPFSTHELERVTASYEGEDLVLGSYAEEIERQLRLRYDRGLPPGTTYVLRVQNLVLTKKSVTNRRYYARPKSQRALAAGWVVLDKPYLLNATLSRLQEISLQLGPVLVDPGVNDLPYDAEEWANHGYTYRERAHELAAQVNYNPKALRLRPYREEKREAEKRLAGRWPQEVLHRLASSLHPDFYPSEHPFKGVVQGKERSYRYGWGYSRDTDFDEKDILAYRDLTLKLWPRQYWWRSQDGEKPGWHGNRNTFEDYLSDALLYVHGVEQKAREFREKQDAENRELYARRFADIPQDRKEWMSEETYLELQSSFERHWGSRVRLCRWLRSEARACGIKMPRKPVIPLSPTRKEQLRRKRRKAAARRRKAARKSKERKDGQQAT